MHTKSARTPNPNAMKFIFDSPRFDNRVEVKKGEAVTSELLKRLLSIEGVDNLFGYQDFLTVNKTATADWEELLPAIQTVFNQFEPKN